MLYSQYNSVFTLKTALTFLLIMNSSMNGGTVFPLHGTDDDGSAKSSSSINLFF